MSVKVNTTLAEELFLQDYKAEWEFSNLSSLGTKSIRTPAFYPVPNVNVGFCFEVWYQNIKSDYVSCFKLLLKKISFSDIPLSLKSVIKVAVYYYDKTLFKDYGLSSVVNVKEMDTFSFQDVVGDISSRSTDHAIKIRQGNLIITCLFRFFGHLGTPSVERCELLRPSNLETFAKNFRSVYNPCVLSDVQFKIGEELLHAHKSILAAHSPVFLKMFTQDFVESKSGTVTIVDSSYESFESFLKYLYSGEIEDKSLSNLRDLIALADKYDVMTLKRECAETASSSLSVENACDVLDMLYKCGYSEAIVTAKKFAATHIEELISKEEWCDLVTCEPVIGYEVMMAAYSIAKNTLRENNLFD